MAETKDVILDAAEGLFAEQGFAETSLRAITAKAEVNLAAVNYHFGSKEALIEAVFARRVVPMNEERVRRLDRLIAQHTAGRVPTRDLIRAFIGPALELSRDQQGGAIYIKLLGRSYTEPMDSLHNSMRRMYENVIERFKPAFAAALPTLEAEELYLRMHFMVGLLAYLMAGADTIRMIASSKIHDTDLDMLVERLVEFVTAGMKAPPVSMSQT